MTDFLRILARVAQYRFARALFAMVIACVMAFAGMNTANAAPATCKVIGSGCAAQTAYAECSTAMTERQALGGNVTTACAKTVTNATTGYYTCYYTTYQQFGCDQANNSSGRYHYNTLSCPVGYTWDPATNKCENPQACLAKNDALSADIQTTATSTNGCKDGCAWSMSSNYTESLMTSDGIEGRAFTGRPTYTGASCTVDTKAPEDQEPECFDIAGQSACKRADGKICGKSATTGKYFCWNPGETGEKNEGPDKQVRKAGNDTTPPSPINLPNGDTAVPVGNPITTNETRPGQPPIATTINNYSTTNGTDAGTGEGDGEGDGEGPGEGDGEGEEGEGNSGSGGGDCETPPSTTGDTLLGLIATQTWYARCATESGNDLEMTGNVSVCDEPFTVSGGDAGAVAELIAMRQLACPADENYLGDGTGESDGSTQDFGLDMLPNGLDESGYGFGGTCPTIPSVSVMGSTIEFNTGPFCDWMHLGGWFVTLLAGLACIRLLTEA